MLNVEYPALADKCNAFTNHDGVIHGAEVRHCVNRDLAHPARGRNATAEDELARLNSPCCPRPWVAAFPGSKMRWRCGSNLIPRPRRDGLMVWPPVRFAIKQLLLLRPRNWSRPQIPRAADATEHSFALGH
jgi:hypothetical protein